jgi:Cu+-exporting ATPase
MSDNRQLILPITGMTCANCVATVERTLKKVDGVKFASVNLSSERATVEFDPSLAGMDDLIGRVRRAGYDVATGEADLLIQRLGDDNDARRLERALKQIDGVMDVQVNLSSERARVRYIPTVISQVEIRKAITSAGFTAVGNW